MRVWVPMTVQQFHEYGQSGALPTDGVVVTDQWAAQQDEADPETLEGLRLESLDAPVVAVVEATATVVEVHTGAVGLDEGRPVLAAVFVADAQGQYSWFGPTEVPEALAQAADWHSN